MTKQEFADRLHLAGETARRFAARYVIESLPDALCFTLAAHDDPRGRRGPPGSVKFLGGRFVRPDELRRVSAARAASLLWVDGKVPAWVNVGVAARSDADTELLLRFCATLVPADEHALPPDAGCAPGNPLVPFRIRGPAVPADWRSVELDGRVSIVSREHE